MEALIKHISFTALSFYGLYHKRFYVSPSDWEYDYFYHKLLSSNIHSNAFKPLQTYMLLARLLTNVIESARATDSLTKSGEILHVETWQTLFGMLWFYVLKKTTFFDLNRNVETQIKITVFILLWTNEQSVSGTSVTFIR